MRPINKKIAVTSGFFGVAVILAVALSVLVQEKTATISNQEKTATSNQEETSKSKVAKGSVMTLSSEYSNPENEPLTIRLEENIPEGTEYVSNSMRQNSQPLTDKKDNDQGWFDEANQKVLWDMGSVAPGDEGDVSYQVKVTGEKAEMQSVTRILIDPGTEDEEETFSDPFKFSLGEEIPVPEVGGPEEFFVARSDGQAVVRGSVDLEIKTSDGRLLDHRYLSLNILPKKFLAKVSRPLKGVISPASLLIVRGGLEDTSFNRSRAGGASSVGAVEQGCLEMSLNYDPAVLQRAKLKPQNLFLVWYNPVLRIWSKLPFRLDIGTYAVSGCVSKLGVYAIGY